MRIISEESIQSECNTWINNTYGLKHHKPRVILFSVPNEIAMMIRGVLFNTKLPKSKIDEIIAIVSQKLKNMGLRSGVSDTICVLPNKVLFIEFKTDKGVQSDSQKEFEIIIKDNGHHYYVIRSLDSFKELINSYLCLG